MATAALHPQERKGKAQDAKKTTRAVKATTTDEAEGREGEKTERRRAVIAKEGGSSERAILDSKMDEAVEEIASAGQRLDVEEEDRGRREGCTAVENGEAKGFQPEVAPKMHPLPEQQRQTFVSAEFDEKGVRKSKRSVKRKVRFDEHEDYERVNKTAGERRARKMNKKSNTIKSANAPKHDDGEKKRMISTNKVHQRLATSSAEDISLEVKEKRAVIGKRIKVFWPTDYEFYGGRIVGYDEDSQMHRVKYEATRGETVLVDLLNLNKEQIIWEGNNDVQAEMANLTPTSLPAPGKTSVFVSRLPDSWPKVGVHVWGRVKGHGWWPGVCKGKAEPNGSRTILFFDDSIAKCFKSDLVPFYVYFNLLKSAKSTKVYESAVERATKSVEKHFSERLRKRIARKKDEFRPIARKPANTTRDQQKKQTSIAAERERRFLEQQNNGSKRSIKMSKHSNNNNKKNNLVNSTHVLDYNGNSSAARLARLSRRFDAMKDRIAPLAIAASQHLREQLQGNGTGNKKSKKILTKSERAQLLEELDALKSFLLVGGSKKNCESMDPENQEDVVAMYGYDDEFDNQIANATFMTTSNPLPDVVTEDNDISDDVIADIAAEVVNNNDSTGVVLDPKSLQDMIMEEKEQPKTPHYPLKNEDEDEHKDETTSDDHTEKIDSGDVVPLESTSIDEGEVGGKKMTIDVAEMGTIQDNNAQ